jgi:hypothetical protein
MSTRRNTSSSDTGSNKPSSGSLTAAGLVPIEIIREEMKRAVVVHPRMPSVSEVLTARRRGQPR